MIRIDLHATNRDDARGHMRRHYPGCVLLDREYGFDMLLPYEHKPEIGAAQVVLIFRSAHA